MTLAQCTKDDLLWLIDRILQMCCLNQREYYLARALEDLRYHKEKARIAEAEKFSKIADAKREEYLEILRPYDGKKLTEVPLSVLEKADRARAAADAAERKFVKLVGLSG